jgi:NADH:ubiquinone oxidoreductase subunit C
VVAKNIFEYSFFNKWVYLSDIVGVDNLGFKKRFGINYIFSGFGFLQNIIFITFASRTFLTASLVSFLPSINWGERECWDMFGVFFINNNSLRRILTDYGFRGYPLRKSFPLSGFFEVRYLDSWSSIISSKVILAQELRFFKFNLL